MNILIHDNEATMFKYDGVITPKDRRGSPYSTRNKLVAIGCRWYGDNNHKTFYNPLEDDIKETQYIVDHSDLIVGFNLKYDLAWLAMKGIKFQNKKIWDCQIAEFLFESQMNKYPSLNGTLQKYNLPLKLDIIEEMYWSKGIDTDLIPKEVLLEYLDVDLLSTERVFDIQKELFKSTQKSKYKLFQLQCADLFVLQEMEYNGLKFNSIAAREEANRIEKEMNEIERVIFDTIEASDTPINLNSNDHLSAVLYGGEIKWTIKVADGVFKSGARVGQIKCRNQEVSKEFARLVEPLDKTETAKSKKVRSSLDHSGEANSWSVAEDVLRQLKAKGKAKVIIDKLLEYSKMEKLKNTYLIGFPDLIEKMNWPTDMIHGNLNQCSVVTGRLSSTKPNLQNVDPATKKFMESRYI